MAQRYTQKEAGRILGLDTNRLRYWERLRLVCPQARWGARFYSFGDLVALRTIQELTQNRVSARRVRRTLTLAEEEFGGSPLPIQQLRLFAHGREVLVVPPGATGPFNPIRRQWILPLDASARDLKVHEMAGRTPEQLFESALDCESKPEYLPQAIEDYRMAVELAPHWVEAHINLGVALYQTGRMDEARDAFRLAVKLDPSNGISRYNLGCVLEEKGETAEAIEHLRRAARAMPSHADVHFNLGLAYEKRGERRLASHHWTLYLRHAPSGPWAEHARARLKVCSRSGKRRAPIPFRRPS